MGSKSDLSRRVVTAIIALILVLPLIFFGGILGIQCLVAVITGIGMWEYGTLRSPPASVNNRLFATVIAIFPVLAAPYGDFFWLAALTLATLAVPAAAVIRPDSEMKGATARVSATLFGVVYLGFFLSFIPALRHMEHGLSWLFLVLVAVWLGDSGAYFAGRALGRHKLAPKVSPNKTWEGTLGGLLASAGAGALAHHFWFDELLLHQAILGAVIAGAMGQLGDLAESLLKRAAGVKDSGTLFPGHGGVLDRIDSLIFAFPGAYLYARLLVMS